MDIYDTYITEDYDFDAVGISRYLSFLKAN